jgi:two-component system response regulator YesN
MYKVLLVDDEPWIVKSLKSSVDWKRHGFDIIGEASNGMEAIDGIRRLSPDLVFTDIRMPGMDGLELMRQVNGWNRGIRFIITSGYKEFDYAKKAIQYGALDYLLKPFEEKEIVEVLRKFGAEREKKLAALEDDLLQALQESEADSTLLVRESLNRLGIEWNDTEGVTVVVTVGAGELPIPAMASSITFKMGRNKRVVVIRGNAGHSIMQMLSDGIPDEIAGVGIGDWITEASHIMNSILEANTAAHQFFVTGVRGVWRTIPGRHVMNRELEALADKICVERDANGIPALFAKLESFITSGGFTIRDAMSFCNAVLFSVNRFEEIPFQTYEQLLGKFATMRELIEYLKRLLLEAATRTVREREASGMSRNMTFRAIVAYIDEHFREDLSLTVVSEKLQLNASYVSQLFRKEREETFLQYLTRRRIECACELLSRTSIAVQEVAEQSGYLDYFHFAKLFKKMVGVTATQYRELHAAPRRGTNK